MKKVLLLALVLFTACLSNFSKKKDDILARVDKDYLYKSELSEIVPKGTSVQDSILIYKNYINNWITERLILNKALKNLRKSDLHFEKQLEEYRNSLIIFKYESHLISQFLDTVVSDAEIQKFYYDNIGNFQLKNNIVKLYYARFSSDLPQLVKIRKFFNSDLPEHKDSLMRYIENYSDLYYRDDETWVLFDDVLRYIPITTYNQEAYLQNNRKIELTDGDKFYFVNFTDFKIKEGESPLSFESENIRQIIINKRKLKIISQMRENLYQTALKENMFEIY